VAAPVELIQRVPLFADLDRKELQDLAGWFKERTFSEGDEVVSEGRGGIGFFVIQEGQAGVNVGGEERASLGPGDHFGEVALIDEGARSATITAKSNLRTYGLTSWEFRPLVENNASIAWKLLQTMAKRLRTAEGD
jgi:CRP-like cAMP-binding protein